MRKINWAFAFSAISIVLIVFWLSKRPHVGSDVMVHPIEPSQVSTSEPVAADSPPFTAPLISNAPANLAGSVQSDKESLPKALSEAADAKNLPVDFNAQVLDQNQQPVAGVRLEISVRHWSVEATGKLQGHALKFVKNTDARGRLEVHGVTGDGIDVLTLHKDGYDSSPSLTAHYGPSGASRSELVIFRLWKLGEKAPLVTGDHFFRIVPDGRTYTIDLIGGRKFESADAMGDFKFSIMRPANITRQDRYGWSFRIEPIDGGILESIDEFMNEAPEIGYSADYAFTLSQSDPEWSYRVKKSFFLKSRGGQNYARLRVEVFAYYKDGGVFDIHYAVNPAGSRNLQQ
jgi:hypothetical protein